MAPTTAASLPPSRVDPARRQQLLCWGCGLPLLALVPPNARAQNADADAPALEAPPEVRGEWPQARLRGQGRLRFLGLRVYDARLWVPPDHDPSRPVLAQPLALELVYARRLVGGLIAERSLEEMRRGGPLPDAQAEAWLAFMREAFPDVRDGDRLTGLWWPPALTRFALNGQPGARREDAAFGLRFFGIWLAPHTSEPALRRALLGEAAT